MADDPDAYDKGFLHCDLLIIGAGPAGLSAALTAGRAGARIILAEEDFLLGGRLNAETHEVAAAWPGPIGRAQAHEELASMGNVRLMPRTSIVGAFDHGIYAALERVSDHVLVPLEGKPRQTLVAHLCPAGRALRRCYRAADCLREIMIGPASCCQARCELMPTGMPFTPGQRVAIFANNDDGIRTANDLNKKGVDVVAVIRYPSKWSQARQRHPL